MSPRERIRCRKGRKGQKKRESSGGSVISEVPATRSFVRAKCPPGARAARRPPRPTRARLRPLLRTPDARCARAPHRTRRRSATGSRAAHRTASRLPPAAQTHRLVCFSPAFCLIVLPIFCARVVLSELLFAGEWEVTRSFSRVHFRLRRSIRKFRDRSPSLIADPCPIHLRRVWNY